MNYKGKVLIGTDLNRVPIVLATSMAIVAVDVAEVSTNACDIGLIGTKDCQEAGLYLWTGAARMFGNDTVYSGTVRRLTPQDSIEELYSMKIQE